MPMQVMVVDNGVDPATWAQLLGGGGEFTLYGNVVPASYPEARTLVLNAITASLDGEQGALPDLMIIDQVLNGRYNQGNDHAGLRLMRTVAKAIELAPADLPLPRCILYTAEYRRDLVGAFVDAGGRAAASRAHLNIGDQRSWTELLTRVAKLPPGVALWPSKKPPVEKLRDEERKFLKLVAEGMGDRAILDQIFPPGTNVNKVHQIRGRLKKKGSALLATERASERAKTGEVDPEWEDEFNDALSNPNASLIEFFLPRLTTPIIVSPYDGAPHTLELGKICPRCSRHMCAEILQVAIAKTTVSYTCSHCGDNPIQVDEAVLDTVATGQHDDHD